MTRRRVTVWRGRGGAGGAGRAGGAPLLEGAPPGWGGEAGGLVHPAELGVEAVMGAGDQVVLLRLAADAVHGLDHLDWPGAHRGLGGEHDGVGAVEDGVGDIKDLGAGRHRVFDHRLHHLRGGDHHGVEGAGAVAQVLLPRRQLGVADLDPQVAAGDHDGVGGGDDLLGGSQGLGAFDLGEDAAPPAGGGEQVTGLVDIGGAADEGHRQVVGGDVGGELDVGDVLGGERRGGQAATAFVDAFVIGQDPAHGHLAVDRAVGHRLDPQFDGAVVEDQGVARDDIPRQFGVGGADALAVAGVQGAGVIQGEAFAFHQPHRPPGEAADADLRPLQVDQDADVPPRRRGALAQGRHPFTMAFVAVVGQIKPHHVHPGGNQPVKDLRAVGGGTQGGDDLGAAVHGAVLGGSGRGEGGAGADG